MENSVPVPLDEDSNDIEVWHLCKICNAKAYLDPVFLLKHQQDQHNIEREERKGPPLIVCDTSPLVDTRNYKTKTDNHNDDPIPKPSSPLSCSTVPDLKLGQSQPFRTLRSFLKTRKSVQLDNREGSDSPIFPTPPTEKDKSVEKKSRRSRLQIPIKTKKTFSKQQSRFKCSKCSMTFYHRHRLLIHQNFAHPSKRWFKCLCGKSCSANRYLMRHQKACKMIIKSNTEKTKKVIDKCRVCALTKTGCICKKKTELKQVNGIELSEKRKSLRQRVSKVEPEKEQPKENKQRTRPSVVLSIETTKIEKKLEDKPIPKRRVSLVFASKNDKKVLAKATQPRQVARRKKKRIPFVLNITKDRGVNQETNHTSELFICKKCDKTFLKKHHLFHHRRLKHRAVKCACGRTFSSPMYLISHSRACKLTKDKLSVSVPVSSGGENKLCERYKYTK